MPAFASPQTGVSLRHDRRKRPRGRRWRPATAAAGLPLVNVLIVDDQASQRTMFRGLLEDISPEIKVADFADPVEALLWSERTLPDLLLLDYRMPKMDGLE